MQRGVPSNVGQLVDRGVICTYEALYGLDLCHNVESLD